MSRTSSGCQAFFDLLSDGMSDGFIEAKGVYIALVNVCIA